MKLNEILFIIVILIIAVILIGIRTSSQTQEIKQWVATQGDTATVVDPRTFSTGPYWPDKNATVYRVETQLGKVYWFKYLWGRQIYQETTPGKYTKVED